MAHHSDLHTELTPGAHVAAMFRRSDELTRADPALTPGQRVEEIALRRMFFAMGLTNRRAFERRFLGSK